MIPDAERQIRSKFFGPSEEAGENPPREKDEIRRDQFRLRRENFLDLELDERPIVGPEFQGVARKNQTGSGNALADGDLPGFRRSFFRDHQGVIGADDRVVIISPEASPSRIGPP